MDEERVGDPAQPGQGLLVAVDDRLVGDVSAGQHDRPGSRLPGLTHGGEQQVVQRGVRQHDPELTVPRRRRRGQVRLRPARQQHDRPGRAGQQVGGRGVDLGQAPRRGQVRGHDRERLVLAVLAGPQQRDGLLAGGVGGQVIAAQSLHGEDPALPEQFGGPRQRLASQGVSGRVQQRQPGPAGRAAGRLRVEAAVSGVMVFGGALLAHRERRHGRQRPVVGHIPDDGEPGAAVGAVDERVPEPPIGRIGKLAQAVRAGRGVRRDQGPAPPGGPVRTRRPRGASLAAMAKDADRLGVMALVVTRSILASGGASRSSRRRNSLTAASGPSTSTNTPSRSLPTSPVRPSPVARVYTNGRKPTPWTTPSTRTAVRISPVTRRPPSAPHLPLGHELRARGAGTLGGPREFNWPSHVEAGPVLGGRLRTVALRGADRAVRNWRKRPVYNTDLIMKQIVDLLPTDELPSSRHLHHQRGLTVSR